jgi:hypothetical protein
MNFQLDRLRRGEWMVASGALGLLVFLVFFKWFEVPIPKLFSAYVSALGFSNSITGWHALTNTRWVLLLAILANVALVALTGSGRRPGRALALAAPALGALATVLVFYRTILEPPGSSTMHVKLGGYLALAACAVLTYGGLTTIPRGSQPSEESSVSEDMALVP